MRAVSPRCAAMAGAYILSGITALTAMAENRPSELKIRIAPPVVTQPLERVAPSTPAASSPALNAPVPNVPVLNAPVQTAPVPTTAPVPAPVATQVPATAPVPVQTPAGVPAQAKYEPVIQQIAYEAVEEAPTAELPAANTLNQEVVEQPATPSAPPVRRPPVFPGRPPVVQMPRRMHIQPAPQQRAARRATKPFEEFQPEPTISPYLNMYRDENEDEGIPNYFAFVRPAFEQQELNRVQQMEMQQLRGQLQNVSAGSTIPATGLRARYMDTAQFYGGRKR